MKQILCIFLGYKQMLTLKTNLAIIKVAKLIINTRTMAKNSSLNSDMNHYFRSSFEMKRTKTSG